MASFCGVVPQRDPQDGTAYVQVLYRFDGKQTSTSFEDLRSATKFKDLVDRFRPAKALEVIGSDPGLRP
jgi:hypothetical protein